MLTSVIFPHPLVAKSAGQENTGNERIAKVGAKNVNVPPWTIGKLKTKTIQNILLKSSLFFQQCR
jgi:hypothetical protein